MKAFKKLLKEDPKLMQFEDVMEVIDQNYSFTPTAFSNGNLKNRADENNGSCKLFAFAKLQQLSEQDTLNCFGQYYQNDVLKNPEGDSHQNIRNFMKTGWQGLAFEGIVLKAH